MYSGGQPEYHVIERSKLLSLLEPGDNLLAIQVHNQSATSSDLSAIPYLSLAITAATASYRPTPSWFEEPFEFISSNLPILLIDTEGKAIENQVRIPARLEIKDTADGGRNVIDQASDFQSRISIEIRGSSSAGFEKKSYGFETQDENGGNLNVSLLGMPEENDWILYGPYSDKSLLRNAITFHLGRAMGRYASRLKFCELVINGDYKGLYILMEKIKRDVQRVNIDALFPDDRDG
ncbi:CotH kinase family protein, partial [candidate division KSB1 bacterium]|nr:CotH kinase family protein [candidate division KSB1 bacterium]